MEAEIISVASQLLRGQIANENAAFLARELSSLGITVKKSSMVGDEPELLKETIKKAEEKVDLVILVGGLGPDENDITKQTISEYLNVPLVLDRDTEDRIITYHKNSDFKMPENNQLQALVLQDSIPIRNVTGLAAGMFYQMEEHTYILLPGPTDELKPAFNQETRPLITEYLLNNTAIVTKTLRVFGLTSAQVNDELKDFLDYDGNPYVAVYEDGEEIEIQITSRASEEDTAEKNTEKIKEKIGKNLGDFVFGYGNDTTLPNEVKKILQERKLEVTAAESLTGGAFMSSFSGQTEASSVFQGGLVSYSPKIKNEILGVTKKTIDDFGVVSSQCAIEMAEKSMKMFDVDIGISLTGVAGPSSLEGKIPGIVWIGVAIEGERSFAKQYHFAYERNKNRHLAVLSAMNLIRLTLLEKPIKDKVFMDEKAHGEEVKEEQE